MPESPTEKPQALAEVGASRFRPLVYALAATAGRAALQRALAFYMSIGMIATIVFEGNGMRPSTLTRQALVSTPFRIGLWAVWLLMTTPAARAVLCTPSSFFLRALPIPRWRFLVVQGVMLALVQLPWLWLWTRGSGPLWGTAACIAAVAGHCAIVARPQRPLEVAVAALLAGALVFAASPALLAGAGLLSAIVFLHAAWLRAPEQPRRRDWHAVTGPAWMALLLAYFASLVRGHGTLVLRALFFVASAVGITYAVARSNTVTEPEALSTLLLTVLTPAVAMSLVSFSTPVLRMEQGARWIFDSCCVSMRVRMAASTGAVVLWGLLLGFAQGLTVALLLQPVVAVSAEIVIEATLAGASLGLVSMLAVRLTTRWNGRDSVRTVVVMILVLVATIGLVRVAHGWAIVVWSAIALAFLWNGSKGPVRGLSTVSSLRRSAEG